MGDLAERKESIVTNKTEGFRIVSGKGFHMTFNNGVTVSVQFGWGNYCDNHDNEQLSPLNMLDSKENDKYPSSRNAEIALFWSYRGGAWLTREFYSEVMSEDIEDDVVGHVSPDIVLKALNWAAKQKKEVK